ncbi:MAG: FHA domain-containing protein [Chloroflexota bacterium]
MAMQRARYNKQTFSRWVLRLGILGILLTGFRESAVAQSGVNWIDAANQGQINVTQLTAQDTFGPEALLSSNASASSTNVSIQIETGDILSPTDSSFCSLIVVGQNQPIQLSPNTSTSLEINGFCREPKDSAIFPGGNVEYQLPSTRVRAEQPIVDLLNRARDNNLLSNYATQLAIWQIELGLTYDQLIARLGDSDAYRQEISILIDNELTVANPTVELLQPPTSAPPTTQPPTALPPTAIPSATPTVVAALTVGGGSNPEKTDSEALPDDPSEQPQTAPPGTSVPIVGFVRLEDGTSLLQIAGVALSPTEWIVSATLVILLFVLSGLLFYSLRRKNKPAAQSTVISNPSSDPPVSEPMDAIDPTATTHLTNPLINEGNVVCYLCNDTRPPLGHRPAACPTRKSPELGARSDSRGKATVPSVGNFSAPSVNNPSRPNLSTQPNATIDQGVRTHSSQADYHKARVPTPEHQQLFEPNRPSSGPSRDHHTGRPIEQNGAGEQRLTEPVTPAMPDAGDDETKPNVDLDGKPLHQAGIRYYITRDGERCGALPADGGIIARNSFAMRQCIIPDGSVSGPHAVIRFESEQRVTIRDLNSTHGTRISGRLLNPKENSELQHGEIIRFGSRVDYRFDLHSRVLEAQNPAFESFSLADGDLWLITRRYVETVPVEHGRLSNPHLFIRPADENNPLMMEIRDLGSVNGTHVHRNGLSTAIDGPILGDGRIEFDIADSHYVIEARSEYLPTYIGDNYKVWGQIYRGEMAHLYIVSDERESSSRPQMVAKIANPQSRHGAKIAEQAIEREQAIAQSMTVHGKNLLVAREWGVDAVSQLPFIVMAQVEGCDLGSIILEHSRSQASGGMGFRLSDIQLLFSMLMNGLENLHNYQWVHCDLKPANIMLYEDGHLVIIDFGSAVEIGDESLSGTHSYSAPEVMSRDAALSSNVGIAENADIYSLGRILFELLTGEHPEELPDELPENPNPFTEMYTMKIHGEVGHLPRLEHLLKGRAQHFASVIIQAIEVVPDKRYQSIQEFREALDAIWALPEIENMLEHDGPADLQMLVERYCRKN